MPITKEFGRYRFHYKRIIAGRRIRASKLLPKGWTLKQAQEYDRTESNRIYEIATGNKKDSEPLIEQAVLLYVKHRIPELKTGKEIERQLAADLDLYEGKLLSELPDVAREIRKSNQSRSTIHNRIAYIRAACRYAYKEHKLGEHDPSEHLVVPKANNERHIYIDRKTMLQIARKCHRRTRPHILIAFYSGMRLGEIFNAKIKNDCFDLGMTKNGLPRIIPIHPKLASVIRHWPLTPARSTAENDYRKARDAAGFREVHFHDLRHSAASEMINAGVDLYTVGAVLGHKDPRSTKRYAHLAVETLKNAIRKIG